MARWALHVYRSCPGLSRRGCLAGCAYCVSHITRHVHVYHHFCCFCSTAPQVTRLVVSGTDASLELRRGSAHIHTACPVLRQVLTDCLMRQLTAI